MEKLCDAKVLVLSSADKALTLLAPGHSWGQKRGKKIKAYTVGWPKNGGKEASVVWNDYSDAMLIPFQKVLHHGFGGSSLNVGINLKSLGMTNVTVAAFVGQDEEADEIKKYLQGYKIKFVPLSASNTARTLAFLDKEGVEATLVMQKPANMAAKRMRRLLEEDWDVIIATSLPEDEEVLAVLIELFEKNPSALKAIVPSLGLVHSANDCALGKFRQLVAWCDVFQVNDTEAGRFLSLDPEVPIIDHRKLVLQLAGSLPPARAEQDKRIVIVTLGRDGSAVIGMSRKPLEIYQAACQTKTIPLDTTGAGDAFLSGFVRILIGLLRDRKKKTLALCAKFGAEYAARTVEVYGGHMGNNPHARQVEPLHMVKTIKRWAEGY